MPFANRAELRTSIAALIMRTGDGEVSDSVLNDWVSLCEAGLARDLGDSADVETRDDAYLVSSEFTALPTGFKGFRSAPRVTGASSYRLRLASPTQIDDECDASTTGDPRLYCIQANQFRVGPIPSSERTLDITYFGRFASIDDSTSNFILNENPDAYLYGSAVHSAPFIGEDGRLTMWKALYSDAIALIKRLDRQKRWASGAQETRVQGGTP